MTIKIILAIYTFSHSWFSQLSAVFLLLLKRVAELGLIIE